MNKKILVADDDEVFRNKHRASLESLGYQVHSVDNGYDASRVLLTEEDIHGAVLDNNMKPGDRGVQILDGIRNGVYGQSKQNLPVVICSNGLDIRDKILVGVRKGVYLQKSADQERYARVLRGAFGDPVETGVAGASG